MKYTQDKKGKTVTLTFSPNPRKVKDGIKIYHYRNVDERETTDYPIAIADSAKQLDWFSEHEILRVEYKRPRLFGLLGHRWEIVEKNI